MFVKVDDLQRGWQVNEAVFASTDQPIILKGTILTEQHIRFLKAFSIQLVDVVSPEEQSLSFLHFDVLKESSPNVDMLEQQYYKTFKGIKEEFHKWQSGMNVEISRIRTIILPFLKYMLENPEQLYRISSFSKKEDYLFHHTVSLGILCGMIAQKMNYEKGMIVQAALAGVLADSGMSKINSTLFSKTTALTEQEFKDIQNHPISSYSMVRELKLLKPEVKLAIYQHHERLDGSGYPAGASGNKIHPMAQIVGIADTYHALTTDRMFQNKRSIFKAIEFLQEDLFGKFELSIMNALFSIVANLVPGTVVELSDGNKGKVLYIHPMNRTRPLIELLNGEVIDLVKRRDLHIERVTGKQPLK